MSIHVFRIQLDSFESLIIIIIIIYQLDFERKFFFLICEVVRLQPFGAPFHSEPNILELKLIGYSFESEYFLFILDSNQIENIHGFEALFILSVDAHARPNVNTNNIFTLNYLLQ